MAAAGLPLGLACCWHIAKPSRAHRALCQRSACTSRKTPTCRVVPAGLVRTPWTTPTQSRALSTRTQVLLVEEAEPERRSASISSTTTTSSASAIPGGNILTVRSRLITGDMKSGKDGKVVQKAESAMAGWTVSFFKLALGAFGPTFTTQVRAHTPPLWFAVVPTSLVQKEVVGAVSCVMCHCRRRHGLCAPGCVHLCNASASRRPGGAGKRQQMNEKPLPHSPH